RAGVQTALAGRDGHVDVRVQGAVLPIDGVVAGANAVGLEDAPLETARPPLDEPEHVFDPVVVDRRSRKERAGAGDVRVHRWVRSARAWRKQRKFSSM